MSHAAVLMGYGKDIQLVNKYQMLEQQTRVFHPKHSRYIPSNR